jgi:hypothetical protein
MFRTYAAWVRGTTEADVAMIQSAMSRKKISRSLHVLSRSAVCEGSSGKIGHSIGHWAASSQGSRASSRAALRVGGLLLTLVFMTS